MHGLDAADRILSEAEAAANANPGKEIKEVHVKVGRFLFADPRELIAAWELIVKDTQLAKAHLIVEQVDGKEFKVTNVVFD
jgi:Zn finger protein HypA/HybF involved in hydrogenase expression